MKNDLKNKIAIVTGASKGMGLATTKAFLNEGVKVMMVARDEALLKKHNDEFLSYGFEVAYVSGDVATEGLAKKVVNLTVEKWGSVDILINNAGGPPMGSFQDLDDASWYKAIDINLLSVIRFTKEAVPYMKKNKWGRVISITSTLAIEPSPLMVLSATARAGVSAFSKAISLELAKENISVNVICPGGVLTDRLKELLLVRSEKENISYEDLLLQSEQGIPAKRFADPSEIANTIVFLASDKGAYINGVSLPVDGSLLKSF